MAPEKAVKTTKPTPKTKSKAKDNPQLAALAHLSILTALFMGPLSMAIPLVIWLLERNKPDKSAYVEFQAKQAFFFQVAVLIIFAAVGLVVLVLSFILIGLLLIPVLILVPLAGVAYGVYAGVKVWNGEKFRYIYLADFLDA
jgi:uncharacterized Tic20 family protein